MRDSKVILFFFSAYNLKSSQVINMVASHGKQKGIQFFLLAVVIDRRSEFFIIILYNFFFFYSLISFLFLDAIYLKVNILVQCLITLLVLMQITADVFQKRNFAIDMSLINIIVDEFNWEKYCAPFSVVLLKTIQRAELVWWRRSLSPR